MIKLVFENSFFIVLDKPAGVSTHNESPSLLQWLEEHKLATSFVNRLDQQTSGLVLVAKNPKDHEALSNSLSRGRKIYRALLRGPMSGPIKDQILSEHEKSTSVAILSKAIDWTWPISDKAEGRKNPQGKASDRKQAHTQVQILRQNQFFTEVLCELKTGRQHQIRKHALLSKHPIVGDQRYNETSYNEKINSLYSTNRMYLHAEEIIFTFMSESYQFKSNELNCDSFF